MASSSPRILFVAPLQAAHSAGAPLRARLEGLRDRGAAAIACFLETPGGTPTPEFEFPARSCGLDRLPEVLGSFAPDLVVLVDAVEALATIERTRPGARVVLEVRTSDPRCYAPLLDPAFVSRVEALIVPSAAQGEMVAAVCEAPLPVFVVPDSLGSAQPETPETGVEAPTNPVVGWVGSWIDPASNWKDFVEVAVGVARRSSAEFWFAADAPSAEIEQKALSEMVRSTGPEIPFRWIPRPNRNDLRTFYATIARSGGCLVSTSSGMEVLDAMRQECPVVVPDVAGVRDLIETAVDGWTYPAGDVETAVRLVESALADAPLRKAVGRAARKSALTFTPDRSADALLNVLREDRGGLVRPADPAPGAAALRQLLSTAIARIGDLEGELASAREDARVSANTRGEMERELSAGSRYVRELAAERESTVRRLNAANRRSAERIEELSRTRDDVAAPNAAIAAGAPGGKRGFAGFLGAARRLFTRSGPTDRPDPSAGHPEEAHPGGRT